MDFETAVGISKQVEQRFPALMVGGYRRLSRERRDSWAIDVVQSQSGKTVTLDEKDDWADVLRVNFPELARLS